MSETVEHDEIESENPEGPLDYQGDEAELSGDIDTNTDSDDGVVEVDFEAPQSLEEKITALEAEKADLKDKLLRAIADAENVRRRAQRDKEDTARYAISNFARELLGVGDNMERAIASVDEETRKANPELDNLMIGVDMTHDALLAAFAKVGISRMEPVGHKFDPNVHEAMFEYDDPTHNHGHVGQVIEHGYMIHGRALRPAKVGVTKGGVKAEDVSVAEPEADDHAQDQKAYESTGGAPGAQIDEEL